MTRRRMLGLSSATLLGMPLAQMMARAGETKTATAEHVILFWNGGGMSHIDSYDHKPGLDKAHGKPLGSSEKPDIFFGKVGLLRKSDFQFKPRGQSGLWLSDMFPNIMTRPAKVPIMPMAGAISPQALNIFAPIS